MINLDPTQISDKPLIYNFFVAFSLFEYALKELGYVRQENYIKISWEPFIDEIAVQFNHLEELPVDVQRAISYLFAAPPHEQHFDGERIGWVPISQGDYETNARWLLKILKTVRNNLFHGGKYPYDPIRDLNLLSHCLVVLQYWADLKPEIHDVFEKAKKSYFVDGHGIF